MQSDSVDCSVIALRQRALPIMANDELHWVSRSTTGTRFFPRQATACASIMVTVDLPTPP
jgi:hypothetical protein